MPRTYEVTNPSGNPVSANLLWPLPLGDGPITLNNIAGFRIIGMNEWEGANAYRYGHRGIYTRGMSDCTAIAIMQREGRYNRKFYFEHIGGGHITNNTHERAHYALQGANPDQCHAVIAARENGGVMFAADRLFDSLNIPSINRTYYASNRRFMDFGIQFITPDFGEHDLLQNSDT